MGRCQSASPTCARPEKILGNANGKFVYENFPRQVDIPQNLIYTDGDAKRFCQDWAVRVEPQCGMKNGDRTKEGLLVKFNIKVPLLLLIMMIPMQSQTAAEK
mmetsp:Transcript_25219/g.71926  ORF Transcript_25219/g.71926 Transcript_25219/m.71926 type:complete len:102 (+) Transcript_25219:221-526(+)